MYFLFALAVIFVSSVRVCDAIAFPSPTKTPLDLRDTPRSTPTPVVELNILDDELRRRQADVTPNAWIAQDGVCGYLDGNSRKTQHCPHQFLIILFYFRLYLRYQGLL